MTTEMQLLAADLNTSPQMYPEKVKSFFTYLP
jgi:hypothetical protein